jgi:hypothetical protein
MEIRQFAIAMRALRLSEAHTCAEESGRLPDRSGDLPSDRLGQIVVGVPVQRAPSVATGGAEIPLINRARFERHHNPEALRGRPGDATLHEVRTLHSYTHLLPTFPLCSASPQTSPGGHNPGETEAHRINATSHSLYSVHVILVKAILRMGKL